MFTLPVWIAIICGVLSLIGMATTKKVSELIAPSKEGFFAIPRTILSMIWFVGGPFICVITLLLSVIALGLLLQ